MRHLTITKTPTLSLTLLKYEKQSKEEQRFYCCPEPPQVRVKRHYPSSGLATFFKKE